MIDGTEKFGLAVGELQVNVGDVVTVDLMISGLGDSAAPSLGVFDIDFGFDPALLSFSTVLFGNGLDVLGLGSIQVASSGIGTVNLFELSLDTADDLNALQPDTFSLATLIFKALTAGNGAFVATANSVGDTDGASFDIDVVGAAVEIAGSVPEPDTLALMVVGLGALGVSLRRRNPTFGAT